MSASEQEEKLQVSWPTYAVGIQEIGPILFLADRMPDIPGEAEPESTLADLARQLGLQGMRNTAWYAALDVETACSRLRSGRGIQACLVVLALVLRTDAGRSEAAAAYFTNVRTRLRVPPLVLPKDEETHREMTLAYLGL